MNNSLPKNEIIERLRQRELVLLGELRNANYGVLYLVLDFSFHELTHFFPLVTRYKHSHNLLLRLTWAHSERCPVPVSAIIGA